MEQSIWAGSHDVNPKLVVPEADLNGIGWPTLFPYTAGVKTGTF